MKLFSQLKMKWMLCIGCIYGSLCLASDQVVPYIVAEKIPFTKTFLSSQNAVKPFKLNHPEASFIKVHFNRFRLSEGGYVIVRSEKGSEQVRYDADQMAPLFAQSINGDSLFIEWYPGANPAEAQLSIDYYTAGYQDANKLRSLNQEEAVSTCGENERRDVACWEDTHPNEVGWSLSVARLLKNGLSLCTAWRVGPDNRMMTNNHCFSNETELKNIEVWFNYKRLGCGGGGLDTTVKVSGDKVLKTDYTLDYTLFTLKDFDKVKHFGYFGLDDSEPMLGAGIYIPQHGAGNPKELAIESDVNNSGLCQIDLASTNGRGNNTDAGYFCDTIGGSSGSPVVLSDSHKVIALHHFGGCENQGVKISKIWPQISSEFGGVLPEGKMGDGVEPPGPSGNVLKVGQTLSNISLNQGETKLYVLPAKARTQNVTIHIEGGSGDADLYVRSGVEPTLSKYDCRPYLAGNKENCFATNQSEDLYVMLRGYNRSSGLSLSVKAGSDG